MRPRSRKVFSAAFVTSLTVAQSIGMTVPATRTGEESSTARRRADLVDPADEPVVLPDIPEQPAGHHPPGGVREGEVLPGDASRA